MNGQRMPTTSNDLICIWKMYSNYLCLIRARALKHQAHTVIRRMKRENWDWNENRFLSSVNICHSVFNHTSILLAFHLWSHEVAATFHAHSLFMCYACICLLMANALFSSRSISVLLIPFAWLCDAMMHLLSNHFRIQSTDTLTLQTFTNTQQLSRVSRPTHTHTETASNQANSKAINQLPLKINCMNQSVWINTRSMQMTHSHPKNDSERMTKSKRDREIVNEQAQ